jgi:hypothetical protein
VEKGWELFELHGLWWAYRGELPPPEAFTRGLVGGTLVVIVVVDDIDQSDSLSHLAPRLPAVPRRCYARRSRPSGAAGRRSLAGRACPESTAAVEHQQNDST